MGQKRAGGVELLAADHGLIAVEGDAGLEVGDGLAAQLRKGIAKAQPAQGPVKHLTLLRVAAVQIDYVQNGEMVLRDLCHRRIARGDDRDHLGQGRMGQTRPAIGLWHVDRPDAALRIQVQFAQRQQPLAVAQRRVAGEIRRQFLRNADRLGVIGQDMRRLRRQRPGRHRIGGIDPGMQRMVDQIVGLCAHGVSFPVAHPARCSVSGPVSGHGQSLSARRVCGKPGQIFFLAGQRRRCSRLPAANDSNLSPHWRRGLIRQCGIRAPTVTRFPFAHAEDKKPSGQGLEKENRFPRASRGRRLD